MSHHKKNRDMIVKTDEKQAVVVGKGAYELVKGDFSPEDASEIINDLFCKKINFLEVKSFSELIRFGSKDSSMLQTISELRIAKDQAKELIAKAKASGKNLRVNSIISIELI